MVESCQILIKFNFREIMSEQMKKTLILLVSLTGALVIILALVFSQNNEVLAPTVNQNKPAVEKTQEQTELPKATGNIEDALNAATVGVADEDSLLKEEESLADSTLDDSSEISSFSQSDAEYEL